MTGYRFKSCRHRDWRLNILDYLVVLFLYPPWFFVRKILRVKGPTAPR